MEVEQVMIDVLLEIVMVMKICPNCLIGVSKRNGICHLCGQELVKLPESRLQNTASDRTSFETVLHFVCWIAILVIGYISIV
jgi:hypothetical protein